MNILHVNERLYTSICLSSRTLNGKVVIMNCLTIMLASSFKCLLVNYQYIVIFVGHYSRLLIRQSC